MIGTALHAFWHLPPFYCSIAVSGIYADGAANRLDTKGVKLSVNAGWQEIYGKSAGAPDAAIFKRLRFGIQTSGQHSESDRMPNSTSTSPLCSLDGHQQS